MTLFFSEEHKRKCFEECCGCSFQCSCSEWD